MSQYPKDARPRCLGGSPTCAGFISKRGSKMCPYCSVWQRQQGDGTYPTQAGSAPTETVKAAGDRCELTKITSEDVRTLDDLIRVCLIDTTTWEIERWVANKWDMGYKDRTQTAHTKPLFQIKAWLKRRVALVAARNEIDALIADAKQRLCKRTIPVRTKTPQTGHMLELSIPDLHFGKLAWGKETGFTNYDNRIAKQVFQDAVTALYQRTSSYKFEQIVFPIGNDLFNADNLQNTTTGGTPQDTDSRYQRTFGIVRRLMTETIESLRTIAPVRVVMVPGNHDQLAVWHLGDSLECYFHRYEDVFIDNAPTQRKYHQFGKVMLMFTHGNKGKHPDYPLVMATEQPRMFGETIYREAHTGHIHKTKLDEFHGVKVRVSPALCPPDAWHAENQHVGAGRSAEAFVWHKDDGLIGTAFYTVPGLSVENPK